MNCNRCGIRQASFKCCNCEENNFLCSQCNDFVHSVTLSQKSHKLELLEKNLSSNNQNNLEISFKDKLGFKTETNYYNSRLNTEFDKIINTERHSEKDNFLDKFSEYKQVETNENFTPSLNTKNKFYSNNKEYSNNENIFSNDNSLVFKQTNYSNNFLSRRNQSCLSNPITDRIENTYGNFFI
jgi:hypothetical protein